MSGSETDARLFRELAVRDAMFEAETGCGWTEIEKRWAKEVVAERKAAYQHRARVFLAALDTALPFARLVVEKPQ